MSAWSGFLHFLDDCWDFISDPIKAVSSWIDPHTSTLFHPSIAQLNRARARTAADITRYTNAYNNYDNKLQNYLSNIDEDKQVLEDGYDNIYDNPQAAAAYQGLKNYKNKLDSMKQQLNKISKKLDNATYYNNYFSGKYNQAVNAKNRDSSELEQGLGEVAGMVPMLFM